MIKELSKRGQHIVFILWGANAKAKAHLINEKKHLILTGVHPSPRSADLGFFGKRYFSEANAYLTLHHRPAIDWRVP